MNNNGDKGSPWQTPRLADFHGRRSFNECGEGRGTDASSYQLPENIIVSHLLHSYRYRIPPEHIESLGKVDWDACSARTTFVIKTACKLLHRLILSDIRYPFKNVVWYGKMIGPSVASSLRAKIFAMIFYTTLAHDIGLKSLKTVEPCFFGMSVIKFSSSHIFL